MQRRGTVIVAVVVCLLVISVLALQLTRTLVLRRRQITDSQNQIQSRWVADSAVARAAARLRVEPDYSGETWRIAADQLGGDEEALAEIKVEQVDEETAKRQIVVQAQYPSKKTNRIATQKTLVIELRSQGDSS